MSAPNAFELVGPAHLTLQARIARGIVRQIERGALQSGARLPGTRQAAQIFGADRMTVVAAYDDLVAQGWVESRPGSGTYVAQALPSSWPSVPPRPTQAEPGFAFEPIPLPELHQGGPHRGPLPMGGGLPDVRLVPAQIIARAWRRALIQRRRWILDYGDPRGEPALRAEMTAMLRASRGLSCGPEEVIITRGSQMGLDLLARTLIRPGDVVAVEAYAYPPAVEAFVRAGAIPVAVPVDAQGVDVEAIFELHRQRPVRLVYVTPHHQYPTGALLSAPRRMKLLEFAAAQGVAIVEDDYDHEFHYRGRPVLPLAAHDDHGVVLYVGSLSKVLAPALRIGCVTGPRAVIDTLAHLRAVVDRQGDRITETAVADLMEEGELARHIRKMRRIYRTRSEALLDGIQRQFSEVLSVEAPVGGMALWARVADGVDPVRWSEEARRQGVRISPGCRYRLDGAPTQHLRIGFAAVNESEIAQGLQAMAVALELIS